MTSELRPEAESDLKPCYRVDTSASVPASGLRTGEGQRGVLASPCLRRVVCGSCPSLAGAWAREPPGAGAGAQAPCERDHGLTEGEAPVCAGLCSGTSFCPRKGGPFLLGYLLSFDPSFACLAGRFPSPRVPACVPFVAVSHQPGQGPQGSPVVAGAKRTLGTSARGPLPLPVTARDRPASLTAPFVSSRPPPGKLVARGDMAVFGQGFGLQPGRVVVWTSGLCPRSHLPVMRPRAQRLPCQPRFLLHDPVPHSCHHPTWPSGCTTSVRPSVSTPALPSHPHVDNGLAASDGPANPPGQPRFLGWASHLGGGWPSRGCFREEHKTPGPASRGMVLESSLNLLSLNM